MVDDDPSIRLSLSYYFRKKCRSFICLETGEQALDHLRTEAYDIILCDYRLPGRDGLSFFREVHRLDLPVLKVLITAFGSLELAIEAIKIGVHEFILKPFNAHTVEQSLTGLIEKHRQESLAIMVDGKTLEEIQLEAQTRQKLALGMLPQQMNIVLQGMLGNADLCLMELGQDNPAIERFDNIIRGIEQLVELVEKLASININQD